MSVRLSVAVSPDGYGYAGIRTESQSDPSQYVIVNPGDTVKISATETSYTAFDHWLEGSAYKTWGYTEDISAPNSDTVYTAVFKGAERTVYFNGNGGTSSQASRQVTNGGTYGTLPTATRTNYNFNNWYTGATGGTQITANSTVWLASNQTIYANWAYSVSYNANGGSGSTAAQIAPQQSTITLSSSSFTAPQGCYFVGWNTKADGTGTSYSPGSTYDGRGSAYGGSNKGNVVLYAQWKHIDAYKMVNGSWQPINQVWKRENGQWVKKDAVQKMDGGEWKK